MSSAAISFGRTTAQDGWVRYQYRLDITGFNIDEFDGDGGNLKKGFDSNGLNFYHGFDRNGFNLSDGLDSDGLDGNERRFIASSNSKGMYSPSISNSTSTNN